MSLAPESFYKLVEARRSIRRFSAEPIDDGVLRRILMAAVRAPSAHNRQPWRFVILDRSDQREQLVAAMTFQWRQALVKDGYDEVEIERLTARNRERLLAPAALVLLFLTMEDMDDYPDANRQTAERIMAAQSVALAGGHILLAAQAERLGACWICAPLFVQQLIQETLGLPKPWEAQGLIAIGHAADLGRERTRMSIDEVAVWK